MGNKKIKISAAILAVLSVPLVYACGGSKDDIKYTMVDSVEEITLAIQEGKPMKLENDIVLENALNIDKSFVFNGGNFKITFGGVSAFEIGAKNEIVADISNTNFETTSTQNSLRAIHIYMGANVKINDCNFKDFSSYGATGILNYDSSLVIKNCSFLNCSQGVMSWTTASGDSSAYTKIEECKFENLGYAVFNAASSKDDVKTELIKNNFVNCGTFVAQNKGEILLTSNTFKVGDKSNGVDKNFKNLNKKIDLVIDSTNKIEGDYLVSGDGKVIIK